MLCKHQNRKEFSSTTAEAYDLVLIKVAFKRYSNTHIFYFINEFLTLTVIHNFNYQLYIMILCNSSILYVEHVFVLH
jgi:hypothetical protein